MDRNAQFAKLKSQVASCAKQLKRLKFFKLTPKLLKAFYRGCVESIIRWNAFILPEFTKRQREQILTA